MEKFYHHTTAIHNEKAPKVVVPFLVELFNPKSVIDIGCGIGTWLSVFKENGVSEILGVDGAYVDKKMLKISEASFKPHDLNTYLNIDRKFDIAICLEVAEHIKESSSDSLVQSLTNVSDTIIFGAAIKGQEGQNHINEQDYEYWQKKFEKHGYKFFDILRYKFWNNTDVDWWYSQNMFVVSKNNIKIENNYFFPAFHPVLFNGIKSYLDNIISGKQGIRFSFKIFYKAVKNYFRR
jgi:predicted RNA methylase